MAIELSDAFFEAFESGKIPREEMNLIERMLEIEAMNEDTGEGGVFDGFAGKKMLEMHPPLPPLPEHLKK